MSCFVCDKHLGEVEVPGGVLFDDGVVAVSHQLVEPDAKVAYPGVLFVEPRRHVSSLSALTREESRAIGVTVAAVTAALEVEPDVERVYLATFGHGVDHLHIWLIPRYRGTPEHLFGAAVLTWREGPRLPREALGELAETLGRRIRTHPLLAGE